MRAAVPAYLGNDFSQAAPGHRFGLYYAGWNDDLTATKDKKTEAVKNVCALPDHSQKLLAALLARQSAQAEANPGATLVLPYLSTSPFATGLGNEHPLENGFSFLTPYGLPYLPGSGVKGVIRRAAEELESGEWGDKQGWTKEAIRALFGPGEKDFAEDRDTPAQQGALRFWDVLPKPPKNSLAVEIMTPHLSEYYQGNKTPNTSLTPNPIPFLAVPAGSGFTFHVECLPGRIADAEIGTQWKSLVEAAFAHAAEWLGFGAKTAVGYGRMEPDGRAIEERRQREAKAAEEDRRKREAEEQERKLSAMTPLDRAMQEVINARPQGQPELKALFNEFKQKRWQGEEAIAVANRLKTQMQQEKRWKEKSEKKKPEKDEDYQMTLAVLAALRGQMQHH